MRSLPLLLVPFVVGPAAETLRTDYSRERTLRLESRTEIDLETTLSEMTVDGEPVDRPGGGGSSTTRNAVVSYHVLEGDAKGPRHVRLAFEELGESSEFDFMGETREDSASSPLEGVVLEVTVDEDGEVACERVEGPSPDDDTLLEGHAPTLWLDAFLPSGAVEEEESWALDGDAVTRGLAGALDPRLFPAPPRPDFGAGRGEGRRGEGRGRGRGPRGGGARVLETLEWSGTATLAEARVDHEGTECARIHVEIEGEADLPDPEFGGFGRGPRERAFGTSASALVPVAGTVRASLKGDLLVSLATHAPLALELDGELEIENSFESDRGDRRFSSHTVQSGQWSVVVTVEEEQP